MKTVLQLTLWLGLLPSAGIVALMQAALLLGGADWPGPVAFIGFGAAYLGMVITGAWVFSRLRY